MGYLLYSLIFTTLVLTTIAVVFRHRWLPLLPGSETLPFPFNARYTPLDAQGGSFADDAEAGFSSRAFDLTGNIEGSDSRAGLDTRAKNAVSRIMRSAGVGFDEARRLFMQDSFKSNNIGPDGRPRDPKFVSFS